ncbi:outer membrane protein assembly factor BamB family protein [Haladaptatus litoreus]|uniref:outer membrane protein assembly factor BamB family protein n=1 Tax=Haladaptatus litoreus TaxID=553468 RepID=UPI000A0737A6|nr:PQQ-binding-like beta-propeller repeat protein [Haladaptatus litoreus]
MKNRRCMPNEIRRTFLKTVGVAIGGASIAGTGITLAQRDDDSTDESTPTGGWTMYRGNAGRTGSTTDSGPESAVRTDWSMDLNGGMSYIEPVVADGTLYLAANESTSPTVSDGYIAAYDPETGDERWKRDFAAQTPVVGGETVFFVTTVTEEFASNEGNLVALDAETGETKWLKDDAIWSFPSFADGKLYATDGGNAYAFDPETGETIWETERTDDTTHWTTPCYADGTLFYGEGIALSTDDGAEQWRLPDDVGYEYSNGLFKAVADGTVYGVLEEEISDSTPVIQARSADGGPSCGNTNSTGYGEESGRSPSQMAAYCSCPITTVTQPK